MLLDELGSGTDPDEGAALSEALLQVPARRAQSPTLGQHAHRRSSKEFAFRHPRAENACVEFDAGDARACYHLIVGMPGGSGALVIARRLGLLRRRSSSARRSASCARRGADALMADMRNARTQAEKARGAAGVAPRGRERMRREAAVERSARWKRRAGCSRPRRNSRVEERVRNAARVLARARALARAAARRRGAARWPGLSAGLEAELSGLQRFSAPARRFLGRRSRRAASSTCRATSSA